MSPPAPWTVLHLDLAEGVRDIPPLNGAAALKAIFRWRKAVLGYAHLLPSDLPMSAAELASLAARAIAPSLAKWLIAGKGYTLVAGPQTREPDPNLSVLIEDPLASFDRLLQNRLTQPVHSSYAIVVCTRNTPAELARRLPTIAADSTEANELIVVDCGPDEQTKSICAANHQVTYIPDPHATFTRARNTGLANATGDAVVFIDDAVDPEAGWIRPLLSAFRREDVAVVYGLSLPASLDTRAQIALEYDPRGTPTHLTPREYRAAFQAGWNRGLPVWQIASGINMAVRRTHALALGGFDERIGRAPDNAIGAHSELFHRALCAGFTTRFEPLSIIRHQRARDFTLLQSQARDLTYRHMLQLFAQYARQGDKADLARAFLALPTDYLKRIAHMPRRRLLGVPDRLLVSDIQGYLAGLSGIRIALRRGSVPAVTRTASETRSSHADL